MSLVYEIVMHLEINIVIIIIVIFTSEIIFFELRSILEENLNFEHRLSTVRFTITKGTK